MNECRGDEATLKGVGRVGPEWNSLFSIIRQAVLNTGHIEVGERIEAKDVDISMHSVVCVLAA